MKAWKSTKPGHWRSTCGRYRIERTRGGVDFVYRAYEGERCIKSAAYLTEAKIACQASGSNSVRTA